MKITSLVHSQMRMTELVRATLACVTFLACGATTLKAEPDDPPTASKTQEADKQIENDSATQSHPPKKLAGAIDCSETSDVIVATVDGNPVLTYRKAIVPAPEGVDQVYSRSGYIHPLQTPNGVEVTGDFPPDHIHQHALFNAWRKTTFRGHEVDFWNQAERQGSVSHESVVKVDNDHFVITQLHRDITNPDDPVDVLREKSTVTILGVEDRSYIFDLVSEQTCIADSPLTIDEYHYGGLAFRGNSQWYSASASVILKALAKKSADSPIEYPPLAETLHQFTTSEGKRRFEGNHSRPEWVNVSGLIDGKLAGVTIIAHPSNFRYPQPVRINPSKPYFCFSPMVLGKFNIEPGETYVSRFRFLVHDGALSEPQIARQQQSFRE